MRCPAGRDLAQADVAIIGVPMDTAVLYRPGARFGPRAIRDASGQMRAHALDPARLEPPFDRLRVVDYGDIEPYPGYIEQSIARIQEAMHEPPQTTRARLRGEFIRTAKERRRDFTVDWVHLKLNDQAQRTVLCKDPFKAYDERVQRLIDGM